MPAKWLFLICACCLSAFAGQAQDTLLTRQGDYVPVKLLEVKPDQVTFRQPPSDTLQVHSLPVGSLFMIKYGDGTREMFGLEEEAELREQPSQIEGKTAAELFFQGERDAKEYYQGKAGILLGVGAATLYFPPSAFVILMIKGTNPKEKHALHPDYLGSPDYQKGFRKQSRIMKRRKALGGAAIGIGSFLLLHTMTLWMR